MRATTDTVASIKFFADGMVEMLTDGETLYADENQDMMSTFHLGHVRQQVVAATNELSSTFTPAPAGAEAPPVVSIAFHPLGRVVITLNGLTYEHTVGTNIEADFPITTARGYLAAAVYAMANWR
jgi:hypothetical protein